MDLRPFPLGVRQELAQRQDEQHQHDLAEEHHAPAEFGGGPAADDRPHGDPRPGHTADHRICSHAGFALEVAGDQRGQCRQHQSRPQALEDRPPQRQHRHGGRHRRHRRAARVDDQPDHECLAPADDVADLAAGEHKHGHDEAIERDDGLNRGDRGVKVDHKLTDGDVHHRLVEDHHKLRDGKCDEWQPRDLRGTIARRCIRRLR